MSLFPTHHLLVKSKVRLSEYRVRKVPAHSSDQKPNYALIFVVVFWSDDLAPARHMGDDEREIQISFLGPLYLTSNLDVSQVSKPLVMLTYGSNYPIAEMLFRFFIRPHSSLFVICLKKPTDHWLPIQFSAPNWLVNQWSVSCLRRMTNGDEQKSKTTSQLISRGKKTKVCQIDCKIIS